MKNASRRFPEIDRLSELLEYNPLTGNLIWRINKGGQVKAGDIAGTLDSKGYIRVRVDGVDYRAHRLCWFIHYGEHPEEEIDHRNRVKSDNKATNLRAANRSINVLNRGTQKNNTTGVVGVNWRKDCKRWTASISTAKKSIHLGYFDSMSDAIDARSAAERLIGGRNDIVHLEGSEIERRMYKRLKDKGDLQGVLLGLIKEGIK